MAYTYLIGWTDHDTWYYGYRAANKRDPREDLWIKYFTSSDKVREFRRIHGEPDVVQVRRSFATKLGAVRAEMRVLWTIQKSGQWHKWLNENIGGYHFAPHTEETKRKIADRARGRKLSDEHKSKLAESARNRQHSEETKQKIGLARLGRTHTEESKQKMRQTLSQREFTDQQRREMSDAARKRSTGRVRTPESRAKTAEAMRASWRLRQLALERPAT